MNSTTLQLICSCNPLFPWSRDYSLADVPVAEEELPAEVTLLNDIIIRHSYQPVIPTADAHHCEVLEELTAQGTGTNQEQLQGLQLLLLGAPNDCNLGVIPVVVACDTQRIGERRLAFVAGQASKSCVLQ